MMSSFLPVNNQISSPQDRPMDDATTPTTPRATSSNGIAPKDRSHTAKMMRDDESTPRNARNIDKDPPKLAAEDSTMHDSDGDRDVSDPEPDHDDAHNAPPSKKKKGQRFYCTDFPPCNLSFTRSEHLARHIRKHTGERPFQCHCSRRFSRLDNLRQHAQTVHVNEEIPGDSLAATGTRFQRQIRTDRVRPQGRARAGTGPSQVSHSRGHARNLSTSSITSTASTFSQPSEIRRRPTSLIMPHDGTARARLALDGVIEPPTTPPAQIRSSISGPPPVGGSPYTPSSMFGGGGGGGGGSPHHLASPMSTASHASSFWDGKTAARRLSVPTGINPFAPPHPQHVSAYPPAPPPAPPSYAGPTGPPPYPAAGGAGGVYASPASSNYSMSRDEAAAGAAEADLRRRTWHPSTYPGYQRPGMSGLSSYQTSDDSHDHPDHSRRPSLSAVNGPAEQHPPRLPGIESFDKVISQQQRPLTPPGRRPPSPMQVDSASSNHKPSPSYGFGGGFNYTAPSARPPPPVSGPGHRRGHVSWDLSLHANLTGLNIRDKPFQRDAAQWGQQTIAEIQNVADSRRPSTSYHQQRGSHDYQGSSGPSHHGWHSSTASGSSQATRTSPEDSSSSEGVHTPSTASLEYHPTIVQQNGSNEPHPYHHYHHQHSHQHQHQYQPPPLPPPPPHNPLSAEASHTGVSQPETYHGKHEPPRPDYLNNTARDSGMGRLEALVAVATSENKGPAKLIL